MKECNQQKYILFLEEPKALCTHSGNAKKGFTLAEVLITLAVIGVVAAMAIPGMVNSTNKQEYTTALLKAYSTLSNASQKIMQENGCVGSLKCTGLFSDNDVTTRENAFATEFVKYVSSPSLELRPSNAKGCFKDVVVKKIDGRDWTVFSGNLYDWTQPKVGLGDGMCSILFAPSGNCTDEMNGEKYCALTYIDINGKKGPNQWGRDTFRFHFMEDGSVKPYGYETSQATVEANCNTSGAASDGYSCAFKVIKEGKMNY